MNPSPVQTRLPAFPRWTPAAATHAVSRIREAAGDAEKAHALEDALYQDVLRAIADGAEKPQELAAAALAAFEINFPRWCA